MRELFVVVYGGHRDGAGVWHPNLKEVARRRRVSTATVRRWMRQTPSGPGIPQSELAAILARRRPLKRTLRREELAHAQTIKRLERGALGRGRGNLAEYAERGWLALHTILVIDDDDLPLRRAAVVRDDPAARRRAVGAGTVTDVIIAENKFAADAYRHTILQAVGPWRLELPATKVARGRTQVWLASAPLPPTPLHVHPEPD